MSNTLTYSGLNTKIHGMKNKLISDNEYSEIAGFSSVTDVIRYLQNHPGYTDLFPSSPDDSFFHRENLEQILTLSSYKNYAKIYNFSSIQQRKFLDLYFMHFEIKLIKQILRKLFNHRPLLVDIELLKPYFERFSDIPIERAAEAENIEELISALSGTKYYKPLAKVNEMPEKNLFDYEISLDLFKFTFYWKTKNKFLKGIDLEVITKSYGYKIDLLNLQWIYRCKKYYNMTTAQILKMVIPVNYKLKNHQIYELIESDSTKSFMEILSGTYYGHDVQDFDNISIEKYYNRFMKRHYLNIFRKYPYSLACVSTYLYLQEQETEKLTLITEGIRYSYAPEEILKMLNTGGDYH